MKPLFTLVLFWISLAASSQNIALSGVFHGLGVDTVKITVMYDAEVVGAQLITSPVYSILLGVQDYYIIKFEAGGVYKLLHFYCYNLKKPITVTQDVHFGYDTHAILWFWGYDPEKRRHKKKLEKEITLYGPQAAYRNEF